MKNIVLLLVVITTNLFSSCACCDDAVVAPKVEKEFFKLNNNLVFSTSYMDVDSEYYGLGELDGSVQFTTIDLVSKFKFGESFSVTSMLRGLSWDSKSDISNVGLTTEKQEKVINSVPEREYTDLYFRGLYMTYVIPPINDYSHMVALGTMPFQNGSFRYYKVGEPQQANGLSMLFDMPFDALVYVGDFSKMTDLDFLQFRIGSGEYMKFRNLYQQNENLGLTPFDTTINFVNFDIRDDNHILKIEGYKTNWVFEGSDIGTVNALGVGYAYDKMDDDGYILYGTFGYMTAVGSYTEYIENKMTKNRDKLIAGVMYQTGYSYDIASAYIDSQLANITPEFVASTVGITVDDTGLTNDRKTEGWAYQIGVKKKIWCEEFDVDYFIGFEYFKSTKDWVSTTLRGFSRNGIDPLIKGTATDLYTGINFTEDKILTLLWLHENRKWSPTSINDVIGIEPEKTNRNALMKRDIVTLEFTWLFLGL